MTALLLDEGFWIAAGTAVALIAASVALRALTSRWWAGAAITTAVAAIVGLAAIGMLSIQLVAGIALLACSGTIAARGSRLAGVALAVPAAALIALAVKEAASAAPEWVPLLVGAVAMVVALPCCDFDATTPRFTGLCFAVAAAGVYVTVPDTETARVLVGASGVSALVGIVPEVRPGPAGSATIGGLIAWNAGVGGWSRPGAVIGGVACVGVLALGPLMRHVVVPSLVTVVVQIVLVGIVARVAGLQESALTATLITAAAFAGAVLVLVGTSRPPPRPRRRRTSGPERS